MAQTGKASEQFHGHSARLEYFGRTESETVLIDVSAAIKFFILVVVVPVTNDIGILVFIIIVRFFLLGAVVIAVAGPLA